MADRNEVTLVGPLVADPDVRSMKTGQRVAHLKLTTAYERDGKTHTEWHNATAWPPLSDWCAENLSKGKRVELAGYLHHYSYVGKDGTKRYVDEVVATSCKIDGDPPATPPPKNNGPEEDLPF